MSIVKRIIQDSIERVQVDELLADEYEQAGYGGIQLTKTPLGAQINLFAMRPGRVIGKRGRAIKHASERLEVELGLSNPQITVVEVEVPELNPRIMASRIANALERGIHFRRAIFWSLRRIMESGALGCEILLKGPLRSSRSRFEKVVEGYVPKAGEPALRNVKKAIIHVKMKRGTLGVTVKIVPPDATFPDKISLDGLPDIEYKPPAAPEPVEERPAEVTVLEPLSEEAPVQAIEPETVTEEVAPVEETPVELETVTEEVAPVEETPSEPEKAPIIEQATPEEPATLEEPAPIEETAQQEETPAIEKSALVEEAAPEFEPVVEEALVEVVEPEKVEEPLASDEVKPEEEIIIEVPEKVKEPIEPEEVKVEEPAPVEKTRVKPKDEVKDEAEPFDSETKEEE